MIEKMKSSLPLVKLVNVSISTGEGRTLYDNLCLHFSYEKVAIIGRNGVGKSTLFEILAGRRQPDSGKVILSTQPLLIDQVLHQDKAQDMLRWIRKLSISDVKKSQRGEVLECKRGIDEFHAGGLSHGQLRRLMLLQAKITNPDLLLLDEPTEDLDNATKKWLRTWLAEWDKGLMVISHDTELLQDFEHFFVVAESGCRYFSGKLSALHEYLENEHEQSELQYVRNLNRLIEQEEHIHHIARRRRRKKQFGRVNELKRATPKSTLNQKRDYAQVKHGRMKKVREERLRAIRQWTISTRRALKVVLPMESVVPELPDSNECDLLMLRNISAAVGDRVLFRNLTLQQARQRLALIGENGAGKTTLIQIIMGERSPQSGTVQADYSRIGYIAQSGANWMLDEGLLSYMHRISSQQSIDELTALIHSHKFPLALASRPMTSLSPGERLRAALICILHHEPQVELLILDEPTYSLDILGQLAIARILASWKGGLVVASHDMNFLSKLGIDTTLELHSDHYVMKESPSYLLVDSDSQIQ